MQVMCFMNARPRRLCGFVCHLNIVALGSETFLSASSERAGRLGPIRQTQKLQFWEHVRQAAWAPMW